MKGKLKHPQYLWKLIAMQSSIEVETFLDQLTFDRKQKLAQGWLYSGAGEALMAEFLEDKRLMLTYKTNHQEDYDTCIGYASEVLQYQQIMDQYDDHAQLLNFDGEAYTLFCRSTTVDYAQYSLRLVAKTKSVPEKPAVFISNL